MRRKDGLGRIETIQDQVQVTIAIQVGDVAGREVILREDGSVSVQVEPPGRAPENVGSHVGVRVPAVSGVHGHQIGDAVGVQVGADGAVAAAEGDDPAMVRVEAVLAAPVDVEGNPLVQSTALAVAVRSR